MAKSPLRLIVLRRWHGPDLYTDFLECKHQQTHVVLFDYDELGHIVDVQPSAKRRRCQECAQEAKPIQAEITWGDGSLLYRTAREVLKKQPLSVRRRRTA